MRLPNPSGESTQRSAASSASADTLHEPSRFVAGAVTFAVFGSAAVTQGLMARTSKAQRLWLAALLMAVGLVNMSAAVLGWSLPLFVASGIIAGAGVGVQFRSSVAVAASLVGPSFRGGVLAALFLIAYAGLAVPVLLPRSCRAPWCSSTASTPSWRSSTPVSASRTWPWSVRSTRTCAPAALSRSRTRSSATTR
jgi:MFS family permease